MAKTIFMLTTDDVKQMAQQMGIDPNKLTMGHFHMIKRGVEAGLGHWAEIMQIAIKEAVASEPIQTGAQPKEFIWYAGVKCYWDGNTYYDKDLDYLQRMIDAYRARGIRSAVTHHGNIHYYYIERSEANKYNLPR